MKIGQAIRLQNDIHFTETLYIEVQSCLTCKSKIPIILHLWLLILFKFFLENILIGSFFSF